ncbi:MAG: type II toxin-antitoxin system VapC family toxin [Thermoanaerobaculia bacterium]
MGIFVDTSALFALVDGAALRHRQAAETWREALASGEPLFTSNYVLLEAHALFQRRLGLEAVRSLESSLRPVLEVDWVDEDLHAAAVAAVLAAARRGLSLVDCTSFEIMRRRGLRRAFTLDADFASQGFEVLPQPAPA